MTTKRLFILLAVVLGGMCGIFLLPKHLGYQPLGVRMDLPEQLTNWTARMEEASEKEKQVLVGSEFAYATYFNAARQPVHVRVVLAGQDMMTGIHRPERCLQAQGVTVGEATQAEVPVDDGKILPVTRLHNSQVVDVDGQERRIESLTYYWFIGYKKQVATHFGRILVDVIERTLKGYNQRWAMVLISAEVLPGRRDIAETDRHLGEVAAAVSREITLPSVAW